MLPVPIPNDHTLECSDPAIELTVGALRDEPARFDELYREQYDAIARLVLRRVGSVHATEDLVSEIFLAAVRSVPRYSKRDVPARFWLTRIAVNAVHRWLRDEGRRPRAVALESEAANTDADSRQAEALAVLRRLSPAHQTVLTLHYLEDFSVEAIASTLDCRVGTVKSRLSRARDAFRRLLAEMES
jgi:RNA polymerase sigma-70 factor (ECF subfamily)